MINLINYALLAEQKKYGYFNKINEDFGQTAENLKLVLSGEIDDAYIEQWNQLITSIEKNIQKDGSYIVMIKDNNKADMVALTYTITNNKIDIEKDVVLSAQTDVDNLNTNSRARAKNTDPKATPGPVTQAIKDAAQKIWVALVGSTFNEEEDDVYSVFRNDIKNEADLQSLLAYWKSLKIPYVSGSDPNYSYKINTTSLEKTSQIYTKSTNLTDEKYTLGYWLGSLFNASEIGKVNSYLPYSQTKFDNFNMS